MSRLIVTMTLLMGLAPAAEGAGRFRRSARPGSPTQHRQQAVSCPDNATAQQKAEIMAAHGLKGHIGRTQIPQGSWKGHEGTAGFRATREDAITNCCMWGQREPYDIGAAQGPGGWFAVVYYR